MVKLLVAGPISGSDATDIFIPGTGPEAAPPLYPVAYVTRNLLGGAAVVGVAGTYPGPAVYPGSDVLPGSGSDLTATGITTKTLTGVPA